ncbi:MAG: hypothetical protein LBC68_07710 [Prevotellaceae bacterium]|jgi:chromosomal replication initiation ATPase DnaA|nr:hypothetical protein [Prevotellaceae bacterium]
MTTKAEIKSMLAERGLTDAECLNQVYKLICAIERVFGCTFEDLKSEKRGKILSYARRVWFWFAKDILSQISSEKRAKLINKHQTLEAYNIKMFENDNSVFNKEFQEYVRQINDCLNT